MKYIVPDHVPSGRWPLEFVVTEKLEIFQARPWKMSDIFHVTTHTSW